MKPKALILEIDGWLDEAEAFLSFQTQTDSVAIDDHPVSIIHQSAVTYLPFAHLPSMEFSNCQKCKNTWRVVAERSSTLDSSLVFLISRVWVRHLPLSKILNHYCFVLCT